MSLLPDERRSCPVAPDGLELPWHVHDDWYEPLSRQQFEEYVKLRARFHVLEAERDALQATIDKVGELPKTWRDLPATHVSVPSARIVEAFADELEQLLTSEPPKEKES